MKKLSQYSVNRAISPELDDLFFKMALILRRRFCTDDTDALACLEDPEDILCGNAKEGYCAFAGKQNFISYFNPTKTCIMELRGVGKDCNRCAFSFTGDYEDASGRFKQALEIANLFGTNCLLKADLSVISRTNTLERFYGAFKSIYSRPYSRLDPRWRI